MKKITLLVVIAFLIPVLTYATEGGVGRPLTGLQVTPYGGIVPPTPGWVFNFSPYFYTGSLGGNRQIPIAGQLAANVKADAFFGIFAGTYIWKTDSKRWNFASAVSVPIAYQKIRADLTLGHRNVAAEDSLTSLYDIAFVPIVASYHFSQVKHVSFNVTFWAPTGDYEVGRLANNGLNLWTYVPNFSYTQIWPKSNVELTTNYGIGFYQRNPDTDYKSGALSNLDVLVMKRYKDGWGVGGVFGWIQQYSDDSGALVAFLANGFKGRSVGLGPMFTYDTEINKNTKFSFSARVLREFAVKNRPEGWPIGFSASFIF